MEWRQSDTGPKFRIDWSATKRQPIDPYLIWFDFVGKDLITDADFRSSYARKLPLLLELTEPFKGAAWAGSEIPAVYDQPLGSSGVNSRFVSARVAMSQLKTFLADKRIKRLQLELARIRATDHDPEAGRPDDPKKQHDGPGNRAPSQTWLGVIDIGCAFAHRNFRFEKEGEVPSTRVRYVWDQSLARRVDRRRTKQPWQKSTGLGYGAELGPDQLDHAMKALPDEVACYLAAECQDFVDQRAKHGFGVLDLAVGQPSPLVAGPPQLRTEPDAAGAMKVVFVQLDGVDNRVTNISSLGVHVLDGLRWMIDRIEHHQAPPDPRAKLVVNISYGGLAGPHDGSSMLERALDELIAKRKNLFVVLAAGNSHQPDLPTQARLKVSPGKGGTVLWRVEPDDPTDSFLEVWFPKGQPLIKHKVRVRVTAPDGSTSGEIAPNQTWLLDDEAAAGGVAAGAMFRAHAANGEGCAMFLLAVQATAGGSRVAQAGLWKLEVTCQSGSEMLVHAWLERDDYVSGNLKRKQQSALVDPGDGSVSLKYGFSSLACGRHTIVAGGYCLSDDEVSEDTASGPGRGDGIRQGPDVSAPSDESRNTPGLLVAGATSGIFNRMSGTSAAAPSVARWIANWCAAVPGAVDIKMLRRAMDSLPGPDPVAGPPPGPEIVPGTVDSVYRLSRIRIDERLEPSLPLPGKTSPMRAPAA